MLASNSMFSRRVVLKAGVLIASILHRGFCANPGAPENRLTSRFNDALWLGTVSYPHWPKAPHGSSDRKMALSRSLPRCLCFDVTR